MRNDASTIVNHLLSEEGEEFLPTEDKQEVSLSRNLLHNLGQLQATLPSPTPDQQRLIAGIRAAANQIIQLHSLGTKAERLPPS